ncbi:inosine-uridine preferring nucleoside hydrolase protein [Rutstroemia sp. NJR-2017a BVV2]|nr:inosine-uridine preferring nucleoside hydrolase protein [Rutstroemia sp. NJR-2017a BVV2]
MKSSRVAAWLLGLLAIPTGTYAANKSHEDVKYVIMDNDWSSTGFIPFLMALDAGWEILGLTSCTADTWQHQVALHALATLSLGNLTSCIPVVPGSTFPLINTPNRFQAWESVHGVLPWQGAFAPYNATAEAEGSDPTSGDNPFRVVESAFLEGFPSNASIQGLKKSQSASAFMIEMVHRYPGKVSIYAGGSMTNIALAVRSDDQFASLAKELVIMGGYIDVNLLEVTGTMVHDHYGTIFPFWDETAAAIMVDSSIIKNTTTWNKHAALLTLVLVYVDVDISYGSPSYGNIHAYQSALMPPGLRNVTYVNKIDGDKLKTMIKRAVQHPRTCSTMGR